MLFHHKIEHLEIAEDTFEPQFEIELAKAGDRSQNGYFSKLSSGGRRSSGFRTTRRGNRSTRGRHTRSSAATAASVSSARHGRHVSTSHKDRYGNQCYGRGGDIVNYGF